MNVKRLFLNLILALITSPYIWAGPVKNGNAIYTQPDGSSFTAMTKGDEWTKIRTTTDGCAIIRQEDGWWCYGIYNYRVRFRFGNRSSAVYRALFRMRYR